MVYRTKKLRVSSTSVGSDISYFHKQTEKIQIRQLLPDLGLLCKSVKWRLYEVKGKDTHIRRRPYEVPISGGISMR